MPGSDASQFTQMKKASAAQRGPSRSDLKSTNRLTQHVTHLSGVSDEKKFLSSLTEKNTTPITRVPINRDFPGKKHSSLQNCA
jgi:hypothetical protein